MNEQLTNLLKFLTDSLQEGKDFAVEQAPYFVKEILLWYFWESVLYIGCAFFVAIVTIYIAKRLIASIDPKEYTADGSKWIVRFVSSLVLFGCFLVISSNLFDAVKVTVAPRVVLVERVKFLLKSNL